MQIDLMWGLIALIVMTTVLYILRNAHRDGTLRQAGLIYVVIGMVMVSVAMVFEVLGVVAPGYGEPLFGFLRVVVFFMGGALFVVRGLYEWSPLGAEVRRQYAAAQRELAERVKAEIALREAHDQLEQRVLERTAALREANRHLYLQALTFATLAEGVVVTDLHGVVLDANEAAAQMFGYAAERIVGGEVKAALFTGVPFRNWAAMRDWIETEGQWTGELEYHHPNGSSITMSCRVVLFHNDRYEPEGFIAVGRDITAQRRAEAELRRNEALLQSVLQSAPARIAVLNHAGMTMLTNQIWIEDFSARAALNGTNDLPEGDLRKGAPLLAPASAESQTVAEGIRAVLDGASSGFTYEYGVDQPAEPRWYFLQVSPLLAERGGVVITHTDTTERKVAEHNLIRQERLALLGRLSATLAHEINNPLQSIRINLDLALDFKLPHAEQREVLETVRDEIERLNSGTVRVLNFARARRRAPRQVEPLEVVQHTLQLLNQEFERNDIRVVLNAEPTPPVAIDPDELSQVCLNLLLNARDSLPRGGTQTIAINSAEGWVTLGFANDGAPIPSDILPRLFEPFFTTKGEGTGLGLYTCQSILEQYGGRIQGENLPGRTGVRFTITLPAMTSVKTVNGSGL